MAILVFADVLKKAGLDPAKVKLIRHSLADEGFRRCYDKNMVREYTAHQKAGFSKGYDYWAVFLSEGGNYARLYGVYRVGESVPDTPDVRPEGYPDGEAFTGENAFFDLQSIDALREYEKRMVIDWGKSARMWHQKGTTEKTIVAIDSADKHPFVGYEKVILTYDKLKEIVEDKINYELWQAALSNVKGVYLILDMANGKQYVGSAYGDRGILGRWEYYVNSLHGNNKLMKEVICTYPERYKYFQFSILQIFSKSTVDSIVVHAENQWKEKLGTIDFGMNDN